MSEMTMEICMSFVVIQIALFPHSWLVTWFLTKVIRLVPLLEQKLLTIPEHLSSPLYLSGVRIAQSFDFCVVFCRPNVACILGIYFLLYGLYFLELQLRTDFPFGIFKPFLNNTTAILSSENCKSEINLCVKSKVVSEWLLFSVKSAIFSAIP
jgi:hypothetical protein